MRSARWEEGRAAPPAAGDPSSAVWPGRRPPQAAHPQGTRAQCSGTARGRSRRGQRRGLHCAPGRALLRTAASPRTGTRRLGDSVSDSSTARTAPSLGGLGPRHCVLALCSPGRRLRPQSAAPPHSTALVGLSALHPKMTRGCWDGGWSGSQDATSAREARKRAWQVLARSRPRAEPRSQRPVAGVRADPSWPWRRFTAGGGAGGPGPRS